MKTTTVDLQKAAALSKKWQLGSEGTKYLGGGDLAHAESLVHELCHAVVLGTPIDKNIAHHVSRRFDEYKSDLSADVSECRALAVEKIVLRLLGWPVQWTGVLHIASHTVRLFTDEGVEQEIRHFTNELAERRARRVIRWLEEYASS